MLLVMAVLQDGFSHAGMILANIIIIFSHFLYFACHMGHP